MVNTAYKEQNLSLRLPQLNAHKYTYLTLYYKHIKQQVPTFMNPAFYAR